MDSIVNEVEMRVVGLERSGNHAIINWLASHYKGKVCFLNCVKPLENPFLTFHKDVVEFNRNFYKDFNIDEERDGKFSKKNCLIYSYEDKPLKEVFNKEFEKNHDTYVGRSKKRYNVLILRDPFNLFASRIVKQYKRGKKDILKEIRARELWKSYAKEYLGITNYLGRNNVVINYNLWFSSKNYRKDLAKKLGLKLNDRKINRVLGIGICKGSTFDGIEYDGMASQMDVLGRWKSLANEGLYRMILSDNELIKLSNKIFGKIPGTEETIKNKKFQNMKLFCTKIKMIISHSIIHLKISKTIKRTTSEIINHIDHAIGVFGIFLKKHFPSFYYKLKKLKT